MGNKKDRADSCRPTVVICCFSMTPQSVSTFLLTPKLKWATFLKLAKLNGSKT